ncbi:hypothetical protein BAUCODRAFT_121589 [Baudoinia panamericana UAMH 10762]|uniref:Cytochrome P450 n=1 Tax=Baudoinia panamericana (strain UAMH 10762) TaxID=717646 RepID=M2MZN1_BAUPA|nr:uncharacterized protein BAUCODRAFT_121589 [Baudoinia panamericana UAMH 10762]EMC97078.1 hypothetical protein BAUCODRAFT_121589 [Baudoinia panamericana UAMH 10762]
MSPPKTAGDGMQDLRNHFALSGLVHIRKATVARPGNAQAVPTVPYWLPIVGHLPNMAFDADGFLKGLRSKYSGGIFALNFGGATHNVMYTPGLATALLHQKPNIAGSEETSKQLMVRVFGYPSNELHKYEAICPDLIACYNHLLTEPSLGSMVAQTAIRLKASLKDLVTGNSSPVDQMEWEKSCNVDVTANAKGQPVVEASLLPLIRNFVAHVANPALIGSDFLSNYPDFMDDLWAFDRGFLYLVVGLPRWLPIPSITRSYIARKRNLEKLEVFHTMMERVAESKKVEPKWSGLDDVGPLVKARMDVYRSHRLSIRARAAFEHALLWAANANSDVLIFWMLTRIYADKLLLAQVREEIEPYCKAVQRTSELPIGDAPQLDLLDVDGLCSNCPLLKSCYLECLRLDTASWSLKVVQEDFVLQSREKDAQSWLLRKGEFAHAAHNLHNTDPAYFDEPMTWRADRHVQYEDGSKRGVAEMGSVRPYGGGSSMCKGRSFAFKECMMFTAAIVAMWDMDPAGGGAWNIPRHKKATGVYATSDETRVCIKQRCLEH